MVRGNDRIDGATGRYYSAGGLDGLRHGGDDQGCPHVHHFQGCLAVRLFHANCGHYTGDIPRDFDFPAQPQVAAATAIKKGGGWFSLPRPPQYSVISGSLLWQLSQWQLMPVPRHSPGQYYSWCPRYHDIRYG
jgi:hypothetical protein